MGFRAGAEPLDAAGTPYCAAPYLTDFTKHQEVINSSEGARHCMQPVT